jgi:hypothetical protein
LQTVAADIHRFAANQQFLDRHEHIKAAIIGAEKHKKHMSRLPTPGSDDNTWGTILNDFLSVSLNADGTLKYGTTAGTVAQGNDSRITGAEQTANKGAANGYAPLNGSSKVPAANLPVTLPPATLTDAATIATDASLGNHFRVTLGGNRTLGTPTNPTDGQKVVWELIQDATGSRTITLSAGFAFGSDISSITLTTTASKRDFLGAVYNATASKWYVIAFVKGY